jgi:hypothetical protein
MVLATCLLLSLAAQGAAVPDLGTDQRLRMNVELVAPARTLEDVCRQLAEKTGVPIAVAEDIEETLVVIQWADAPASSLMDHVARLFEWEWKAEGDGYRLVRSDDAERREKARYDAEVLTSLTAFQASIDKAIQDANRPQTDEEKSRIAELRRAINTPPSAGTNMAVEKVLMMQQMLEELTRLEGRSALPNLLADLAFRDLTHEQLLTAARNRRIVLSTAPNAAQAPLSARAARTADSLVRELTEGPPNNSSLRQFRPQDVARVTIAYTYIYPTAITSPTWEMRVELRDGNIGAAFRGRVRGDPPELERLPITKTRDSQALAQQPPDLSQLQRTLNRQYPLGEPNEPVATALISIANAAKCNLVGEITDTMGRLGPYVDLAGNTCGEMLDVFCPLARAEWSLQDGVIVVRPAPFRMLYRARTIRRSVLQQITKALKDKSGLTLDEAARFAASMTDDEWFDSAFTTSAASGVVADGLFSNQEALYILRAWNALGRSQRERLLAGDALRVDQLGQEATLQLWQHALLFGSGRSPGATASLSPSAQRRFDQVFGPRPSITLTEPTDLFPSGLPRDAVLRVVSFTEPGVGVTSSTDKRTLKVVISAHQAGMRSRFGDRLGLPDLATGSNLTPATWSSYMFEVATGEHSVFGIVGVGSTLPDAKPASLDDLPEEIRNEFRNGRGGGP